MDIPDNAEVVVDLERARLDALAARAGPAVRRRGIGLDDAEADSASGKVAGQNETSRPGAGDQDFSISHARALRLQAQAIV
jgi:hypothetical protein